MNIYNLCTVCAVALYLYLLAEDRRAAAALLAYFVPGFLALSFAARYL
jgi:hypothetical protein